MRLNALSNKRLVYKVIQLDGKELMKFYSRKVALAYAINEDAVLIHNITSARMRRSLKQTSKQFRDSN